MFQSVQAIKRGTASHSGEISMAPLIDMVFILLIFFLVTTSFVSDTGIEVERATAATAVPLSSDAMRVSITASGGIYLEGQLVELNMLQGKIQGFLSQHPNGSIVVIPDKNTVSGRLVEVMDIAKIVGTRDIAVATE
ncbi:MAG: biopolymer transporter ExbD [Phycisphaeraceae bacterium]|nr:biopolymer transporter ExbD [Phycisphaeraceae bacterium]|tara:strand:- start:766 stop:1176 length:411 start_codon:yes stop_codon:yes gene_type:complete